MEGKASRYTRLRMGGIGCYSKWKPGSTGMETPGVLLAQSFKSIACFGRAFHMKGSLAVMADAVFFGELASVLEHAGRFRLLYKGVWVRVRQQKHERWCEGWLMRV